MKKHPPYTTYCGSLKNFLRGGPIWEAKLSEKLSVHAAIRRYDDIRPRRRNFERRLLPDGVKTLNFFRTKHGHRSFLDCFDAHSTQKGSKNTFKNSKTLVYEPTNSSSRNRRLKYSKLTNPKRNTKPY